ncbi:MAG TPA: tripartite tricarboxylate transporter substrate binding protein [Burkholderiales bacterium]|nr:tripartite tricarboxylate transporter substrate binding protein [Burkholderiales bacterium]
MKRLIAAVLLAPVLVLGQGYPNKPVKMIIPFAPGGASDFVGRIIQPNLSEVLGQQVVIENRPGASGNIGVEAAARSAPDGYTIVLGNVGSIAINPGVFPKLAADPLKDLVAVTQVVDVPGVLVAHPAFPPNSVKEFVAYAKANPGKVNYASPGSGSQNRLEMEKLRNAAGGLDMVHVPYKGGAGPAVSALVAGETHLMFVTASSAMPMIKSGRLKVLAVAAPKRLQPLPDVPTMSEAGYPAFETGSWQGVLVPAGTPKEVVERLYAATVKTMQTREVRERLGQGGVEVVTSASPAAFEQFVADETARWGKAAKEAGATVD